jgi:hypothetical protein
LNVLGQDDAGRDKILNELKTRIENIITSPQWLTFYG